MALDRRLLPAQRAVLVVAIVGAAIAMRPGALDVVDLPKVALLAICVGAAGGIALARTIDRGVLQVPRSPVLVAAAVFALALVLAAVTAPHGWLAWVGLYGRWLGAAPYLLYLALGLLVASTFADGRIGTPIRALLVAAGAVIAYGLLQYAGLDPLPWRDRFGRSVFSTLGNPNFAGAYLGVVAPLAVWQLFRARTTVGRYGAGALVAVGGLAVWMTDTFQGPITATIGLAVLAAAWLSTQPRRIRTIGLGALLLVPVLVIVGVLAAGLLPRIVEGGHLDLRGYYWAAAWSMFTDSPLLGAGMNQYEALYRDHISAEAALRLGAQIVADQPHSVPLAMLASGGIMLGVAYLGVIITTGWALLQAWGHVREQGGDLLLVGALAGSWVAYHAQSAISIDAPPLASLHWVLIGLIVVASRPGAWTRDLPWHTPRKGQRQLVQRWSWVAGVLAFTPFLVAAGWWIGADVAVGQARRDGTASAHEKFHRATTRVPWEASYHFHEGDWHARRGDLARALDAFEAGAHHAPWDLQSVVSAARSANALDQHEQALRWYEQAIEVEPWAPDLKVEAAAVATDAGESGRSRELLQEALEIDPEHAEARELLGGTD